MDVDSPVPKSFLVVGGGTAGWMTAHLLKKKFPGVTVSVLESKDVGIVGVGEGSTPHLKFFFDEIGVFESEWMSACNATYKNGIYFKGWSSSVGEDEYFHPFPAQVDDLTMPMFFHNIKARRHGYDVPVHPDQYFLESYITQKGLAPLAAESFPFSVMYGYHFDSGLLGRFLKNKARSKGISYLQGTVEEVRLDSKGDISALRLDGGRDIRADFYVDCTGFQSLLLQKSLKEPFVSFKDNLFNDSAVVLQTPISSPIPPATRSTAMSSGWAWEIPLTNRYGNGYVYSSDYISQDDAEAELRKHLGLVEANVSARHLKMQVGRVKRHWVKNCLAVGLSQGFIEPLEATALALVYETVSFFLKFFEQGSYTNRFELEFNKSINDKFEGIRDYIVCHYKASLRCDTKYWRDNAENRHISSQLALMLDLWANSKNFEKDVRAHGLHTNFPPRSWACLLAGYNYFPSPNSSIDAQPSTDADMDKVTDFIRRCGLNFRPHNEVLGL